MKKSLDDATKVLKMREKELDEKDDNIMLILQETQQVADQNSICEQRLDELSQRYQSKETELSSLKDTLNKAKTNHILLKENIEKMQNELEKVKTENVSLKDQNSMLKSTVHTADTDKRTLNDTLRNKDKLIVQQETGMNELRTKIEVLQESLAFYCTDNVKIKNKMKYWKELCQNDTSKQLDPSGDLLHKELSMLSNDLSEFKKEMISELSCIKNSMGQSLHTNQGNVSFNQTTKKGAADTSISHRDRSSTKPTEKVAGNVFGSLRCTSNNPISTENSPDELGHTISPGNALYSEATGRKALIFSTSMTRMIEDQEFQSNFVGGTVRFQRFRGGRSEYIKHYVVPHLIKEKPKECIIQAGGNDLPTSRNNPTPVDEIADHIIDIGKVCRQHGATKVDIMGVMPREQSYMQVRRRKLNILLKEKCLANGFGFISNEEIILSEHIWKDGVHLNKKGTEILSDILLNHLNDCSGQSSISRWEDCPVRDI